MKMAEAVKSKKLKPGASIPGCNSYFLCKYLKDTMLQARTYLFCAIRPEVKFHNYTFSTLGFAKNASVIKLQPKKACTASSPAERKLMAELDQMKLLVASLQTASGGGGGGDPDEVAKLTAMLESKQAELQGVLGSDPSEDKQNEMMQRQREEYGSRGISLTHFESETTLPHLINLDVDGYRSKRFMFIFEKENTSIGTKGDIKPMSLSIVADHCSFEKDENDVVTLVTGAGDVIYNGEKLSKGDRKELTTHDRLAIGNELMLFIHPGSEPDGEPPSAEEAATEYQNAQSSGGGDSEALNALQEQLKKFEEEKAMWEKQKAEGASNEEVAAAEEKQNVEKEKIARQINDQELREILPKLNELKQIVTLLNRDMLSFDTALQGSGAGQSGIPKVKVKVHNALTSETIFLDVFEFVKAHALLKDEVMFLKNAVSNNREYTAPLGHDPINLLFDNSFHIGSATSFPEYLLYNLETDPEEAHINIKLAVPPFSTIGKLKVEWKPMGSDNEDDDIAPPDVDDPSDLIGKPWYYKITIKEATGLPIITDLAYCQYEFFGELFTTETVEQNTRSPEFEYSFIHHIDVVTQPFIDYLMNQRIEFAIFASPYIMDPPKDKISTDNAVIVENLGGTFKAKESYDELKNKCSTLEKAKVDMENQLEFLKSKFKEMTGNDAPEYSKAEEVIIPSEEIVPSGEEEVAQVHPTEVLEESSTARQKIDDAIATDAAINATEAAEVVAPEAAS